MFFVLASIAAMIGFEDVQHLPRNWNVYKNEDNCALMRTYEGDAMLRISYSSGSETVWLTISDPAFKSIESKKKYPLKIIFLNGEKSDFGWGTVDATGIQAEGLSGFTFKLTAAPILADIRANAVLGVMREDRVVASLKLDGSDLGIEALKVCALRVEKQNPSDPFAD